MASRFAGKVIVITGGATGIGRACALAFAQEGGAVVIGDIEEVEATRTLREINDAGGRGIFTRCDVTKIRDARLLIDSAVDAFGGVDVLCNVAGAIRRGKLEDVSEEDWEFNLSLNLKAPFMTCKYAIPEMRKRGGGAIVNTSSVAAFAVSAGEAAYAAAKGGIVSFTRAVALDHAAENIRCNCIAPGAIHTPMLEKTARIAAPDDPDAEIAAIGRRHPVGRVGRPEEVAKLVIFLASDDALFCTGGCYPIDGGVLAPLFPS